MYYSQIFFYSVCPLNINTNSIYCLLFPKASKQISKTKCHIVSPLRKSPVKRHNWTYEEDRTLVEFLSVSKTDPKYCHGDTTEWPSFRDSHSFWREAALHVKTSTRANILLTSMCKAFFFIINQQIESHIMQLQGCH